MSHIPVLQKEVLEYLDPKPNKNFIDCTVGEGGHTLAILDRLLPKGRILGIDFSPELIGNLGSKIKNLEFRDNLILVCDNFANLKKIVEKYNFIDVSGILFDLGVSSWHLKESKRGFSFQRDESLDMRYNPGVQQTTAAEIVNNWSESEIERILKDWGQEKFAGRIAKEIINLRKIKPIESTFQLVEIIKKATPGWYHKKRIHFATKTFQSLRIAVNDELNNLKKGLSQALEILASGGRLAIISFHSLEDRIVKNFLRENICEATGYKVPSRATPLDSLAVGHLSFKERGPCLRILTKKLIGPKQEEVIINPSSRSAKLRVAEKI